MQTTDFVLSLIKQLSDINLDNNGNVDIVTKLQKMSRTGKEVRINKYNLNIKKRSLYCHILGLAFIIDSIQNIFSYNFDNKLLAKMCVFHDLSELIFGDIPEFTPKFLAGDKYLNKSDKRKKEKDANLLLSKIFPKTIRFDFKNTVKILDKKNKNYSEINNFFLMVDKIDPIISMWRYIYFYKSKIDIEQFLEAMTDFFDNPNVEKYGINDYFKKIIKFLQSKMNARKYYSKGNIIFETLDSKSKELLKIIIEGKELYFV